MWKNRGVSFFEPSRDVCSCIFVKILHWRKMGKILTIANNSKWWIYYVRNYRFFFIHLITKHGKTMCLINKMLQTLQLIYNFRLHGNFRRWYQSRKYLIHLSRHICDQLVFFLRCQRHWIFWCVIKWSVFWNLLMHRMFFNLVSDPVTVLYITDDIMDT
jgi:hypothetical protein